MSTAFSVACPHCVRAVPVEYADRLIYDLICRHCGGAFCLFVRRQKFEVLFELGTEALLAGYAREAVSSFAAALERCFEFYVWAFALEQAASRGLSLEEAQAALEATWKLADRQSERQLGMLALAYLLREGRPPDFLKPQVLGSEFRNAVIHRGALPRREEVENYAAQVFEVIDRLLRELGPATLQVQLLDELEFSRHFAGLPTGNRHSGGDPGAPWPVPGADAWPLSRVCWDGGAGNLEPGTFAGPTRRGAGQIARPGSGAGGQVGFSGPTQPGPHPGRGVPDSSERLWQRQAAGAD
ncbi:hypothetical protein [Deinococcus sp. Marseille-Q6407]|uniref:hypothetical protein n=1 Tax=Deinococcus sp. Marseille-Q6407 TaxID=2969223 RepID=UPI0028FC111D|nr:hypothetical protein [Deinococcus sp. Marseille-Q6407]